MKVLGGIFLLLILVGACNSADDSSSSSPDGGSGGTTVVTRDDADMYCSKSSDDTGAIRSAEVCIDRRTGEWTDTTTGPDGEDNSDVYGTG